MKQLLQFNGSFRKGGGRNYSSHINKDKILIIKKETRR